MTFLRSMRKAIFGETWILPSGIGVVVLGAVAVRSILAGGWTHVGGFVILAGVACVLLLSVTRTSR